MGVNNNSFFADKWAHLPAVVKEGDKVLYNGYVRGKKGETVEAIQEDLVLYQKGSLVVTGIKKGINVMGEPYRVELGFHVSRLLKINDHAIRIQTF